MHTPLGKSVDSCISFLQNFNRRETVDSKTLNRSILNENYIDMTAVIPTDNKSELVHDIEQPTQETSFGESKTPHAVHNSESSSAVHVDEIYAPEELAEFDELRSSTPHIWQENSSDGVNIVQAQVHASNDANSTLSPVKYLEGHVRYLSPTMGIRYMTEQDALNILNDKVEYE